MNLVRAVSMLGCGLLALAVGACGTKPMTPAETLTAADRANSAGQPAEAVKLYDQILAWQGEGTVSEGERFKASLEAVKCLLQLDRTEDAVARYQAMFTTFEEMKSPKAYLNTIAVLDTLDRAQIDKKNFGTTLVKVAEIAEVRHPTFKDKFQDRVRSMMKKLDPDDENTAKLKTLGYL